MLYDGFLPGLFRNVSGTSQQPMIEQKTLFTNLHITGCCACLSRAQFPIIFRFCELRFVMANNTTAYNSSLPSEASSPQFQCLKPMDITASTMNAISFLINIFHLIVITCLESLKGTQYRHILINISLADMINTLVMAVFYSCYDFFIYIFEYADEASALRIPINTLVLFVNYVGYHVFLVASIQKYLAICKPISYQSSPFVKRLPIVFVLAWIYVFLLNLVFPLMEMLASILLSREDKTRMAQAVLLSIPPNIITGVLLVKVYRAMKVRQQTRKTMNATSVDKPKGIRVSCI